MTVMFVTVLSLCSWGHMKYYWTTGTVAMTVDKHRYTWYNNITQSKRYLECIYIMNTKKKTLKFQVYI